MSKLSLLLAPLSAVGAFVVLLGPSGALHGSPAARAARVAQAAPADASASPVAWPSAPGDDAVELEVVVDAYRLERSLQSAADLLDAAIRLDGPRRDRVLRLEAFGPPNPTTSGAPEVGHVLDEDGRVPVVCWHEEFPEHAELERAAAKPWYEAEERLLLQSEVRAGASLGPCRH